MVKSLFQFYVVVFLLAGISTSHSSTHPMVAFIQLYVGTLKPF